MEAKKKLTRSMVYMDASHRCWSFRRWRHVIAETGQIGSEEASLAVSIVGSSVFPTPSLSGDSPTGVPARALEYQASCRFGRLRGGDREAQLYLSKQAFAIANCQDSRVL